MEQRVRASDKIKNVIDIYNVSLYFRPPSSLILPETCVVYDYLNPVSTNANNKRYLSGSTFRVTFMCAMNGIDISTNILDELVSIEGMRYVSNYVEQDVVHHVYNLQIRG